MFNFQFKLQLVSVFAETARGTVVGDRFSLHSEHEKHDQITSDISLPQAAPIQGEQTVMAVTEIDIRTELSLYQASPTIAIASPLVVIANGGNL